MSLGHILGPFDQNPEMHKYAVSITAWAVNESYLYLKHGKSRLASINGEDFFIGMLATNGSFRIHVLPRGGGSFERVRGEIKGVYRADRDDVLIKYRGDLSSVAFRHGPIGYEIRVKQRPKILIPTADEVEAD